jgi:hypothetical protein
MAAVSKYARRDQAENGGTLSFLRVASSAPNGELHDGSLRLIQSAWRFPLPPFLVSRIRPSDSTNCISPSAVNEP